MKKSALSTLLLLFCIHTNTSAKELSDAELTAKMHFTHGEYICTRDGKMTVMAPLSDDAIKQVLQQTIIPKTDPRHAKSAETFANARFSVDYPLAIQLFTKYIEQFAVESRGLKDENKSEHDYYLAQGFTGRGRTFMKLNQIQESIADLTEALRLYPDDAMNYNYRSKMYLATGKKDLAQADQQKIAALFDKQNAKNGSIDVWKKMSEGELRQKLLPRLHLSPDVQLVKENEQLFLCKVITAAEINRATTQQPKNLSKLPNLPVLPPQYNRVAKIFDSAKAFAMAGDSSSAILKYGNYIYEYNKVTATAPGKRSDWNNYFLSLGFEERAACYFKQSKYQKAIDDLTMAIKLRPRCTRNYASRARIYRLAGSTKLAEADDARIHALPPITTDATQDLEKEFSSH